VRAVKDLSFDLGIGETIGIVGESGSGKSVSSLAVMGLLPKIATVSGQILFRGQSLLSLGEREMRAIRGQDIGMIFQDPMTSMNPYLRIGYQLSESLRVHKGMKKMAAKSLAIETMTRVGIADADIRFNQYPHEFSGGMRQRAMIAMALMTKPKLLIADEPTTALDVTTQRQILAMIRRIQREDQMSVIFISHDLAVVSAIADRCLVMYAGEAMETGRLPDMLLSPRHPYTRALLAARPSSVGTLSSDAEFLDRQSSDNKIPSHAPKKRLLAIEGSPPNPRDRIVGCPFAPRCSDVFDMCKTTGPQIVSVEHQELQGATSSNFTPSAGSVKCWKYSEVSS